MYNPQRFKSADINETFDLMDKNPFATVITVIDGKRRFVDEYIYGLLVGTGGGKGPNASCDAPIFVLVYA